MLMFSQTMSKNSDRDIVVLNSSPIKDKKDYRDSRGKNCRDSRGDNRGSGRNDRNSTFSQQRDHRERSMHDHRNSGGSHRASMGGNDNGSRISRQSHNVKFSGMAFTENELLADIPKKKFTGRCRLFIGNIPNEVKESELKEMFIPYGDISECFMSGKGFAFLRLDTRAHAESAKEALDGKTIHGRQVRVRFAVHGATIRVKELAPVVSNEMLHLTFSAFGEVERAVHIVDEKGKPTGEGIIEFERKAAAMEALTQIKERVFLMTANSRPLIAELLEPRDEEDGLAEKMLQRTPQLLKERELGPRFASVNSFEHVYGQKWKELYEIEKKRQAELKQELLESRKRLDADMEIAYEDYKTQLLREDLMRRQQELERLEAAKRERMQRSGGTSSGTINSLFSALSGGVANNDSPIIDGPLGRGSLGSGGGRNLFYNGNSGSQGPGQVNPSPLGPSALAAVRGGSGPMNGPDTKIVDVQKLLQNFKNDGPRTVSPMRGGPLDRHPGGGPTSLPSHLLNIMGPFANALTGHGPARPHGGIPRPSDVFQPPEKRLRR